MYVNGTGKLLNYFLQYWIGAGNLFGSLSTGKGSKTHFILNYRYLVYENIGNIKGYPLLILRYFPKSYGSYLVCVVRLFRKKESAEVGRDPAVSMLNLANHHNSYSNKSYHINIFRPISA